MGDIVDVPFNHLWGSLGFELKHLSQFYQQDIIDELESPHRPGFYQMLLFTKGQGRHSIDFSTYTYRPGTLLFIAPYQIVRYAIKRQNEAYLVLFTDEFVRGGLVEEERVSQLRIFDHFVYSPKIDLARPLYANFSALLQLLSNEAQRPRDFAQAGILRSLLCALLMQGERLRQPVTTEVPHHYRRFSSFMNLLEKNYQSRHKAQDYARDMGVSTKGLNSLTRRVSNRTAKALIDQRLVLEAKRLLVNSEYSVKEIAYRLGFDEPTNFIKYFKRHSRQTPEKFRHVHG
ncbi:MAG: helix-turn-helix domain-containing protein [Candidatus Latescibacteria bacterium]|nr:helix-turn-helix domain-containing protein [Candidatus Latescibacterota bacterium]